MPQSSSKLGRLWRWVPALAMAVLIFVLSSIPGSRLPSVSFRLADKLAHALVYAVLGALLALGLRGHKRAWDAVLSATILGAFYGLSDELHQHFTPHRSSDVLDALADAIGAFVGALLVVRPWKRTGERNKRLS